MYVCMYEWNGLRQYHACLQKNVGSWGPGIETINLLFLLPFFPFLSRAGFPSVFRVLFFFIFFFMLFIRVVSGCFVVLLLLFLFYFHVFLCFFDILVMFPGVLIVLSVLLLLLYIGPAPGRAEGWRAPRRRASAWAFRSWWWCGRTRWSRRRLSR